jgi:hypothetical protein
VLVVARLENPPDLSNPDFWTDRGSVMAVSAFVMVLGSAPALFWALQGFTDGLRALIAILPAILVFLVATKG